MQDANLPPKMILSNDKSLATYPLLFLLMYPSILMSPSSSAIDLHCQFPRVQQLPCNPVNDADEKHLHEPDEEPQDRVRQTQTWPPPSTIRRVLERKRNLGTQMFLCDKQAAAEAVLVEAVLGPRPSEADAARVLNLRKTLLGLDSLGGIQRMPVDPSALYLGRVRLVERVERHEDVAKGVAGDVLQDVHVVGEADLVDVATAGDGGGGGHVVPACPGFAGLGHEGEVGVQDGDVVGGVKFGHDFLFCLGGRAADDVVGLVAVGSQDDVVENFGPASFGMQADTAVWLVGDLGDFGV